MKIKNNKLEKLEKNVDKLVQYLSTLSFDTLEAFWYRICDLKEKFPAIYTILMDEFGERGFKQKIFFVK